MKPVRTLREFRERLGLTQGEFAERAGLSAVYLCQVETGRHAIGRDAGLAILDAFRAEMQGAGLSLEDLLRASPRSAA